MKYRLLRWVLALLLMVGGLPLAFMCIVDYTRVSRPHMAHLQLTDLAAALELLRSEIGRYPTEQEGLSLLIANPDHLPGWQGPYLKRPVLPPDPWDNPYVYRSEGPGGCPYRLYSPGENGDPTPGDEDNIDLCDRAATWEGYYEQRSHSLLGSLMTERIAGCGGWLLACGLAGGLIGASGSRRPPTRS